MQQEIAPIGVRPSLLNGISQDMMVSHYENNYGSAVRTLNAVRRELAALDSGTPPYRLRGLKSEELALMGSVARCSRSRSLRRRSPTVAACRSSTRGSGTTCRVTPI